MIVDHLKAVRTLVEYVSGGGLKKDVQGLTNHLQQDLSRSVLRPAGWEDLYVDGVSLYSSPSKSAWRVVKGDVIAIQIYPAGPVQKDEEPSVNLYVPTKWKKRQAFIDKLKAPPGFQHVSEYADGELTEDTAVFKYVPYTSYVGAEGLFDCTGFIDAFREAAKTLVGMEKVIDGILERLA